MTGGEQPLERETDRGSEGKSTFPCVEGPEGLRTTAVPWGLKNV